MSDEFGTGIGQVVVAIKQGQFTTGVGWVAVTTPEGFSTGAGSLTVSIT